MPTRVHEKFWKYHGGYGSARDLYSGVSYEAVPTTAYTEELPLFGIDTAPGPDNGIAKRANVVPMPAENPPRYKLDQSSSWSGVDQISSSAIVSQRCAAPRTNRVSSCGCATS